MFFSNFMTKEKFSERYQRFLYEYNEGGLRDYHLLNDYLGARNYIMANFALEGEEFYSVIFSRLEEIKDKKITETKERIRKSLREMKIKFFKMERKI